MNSTIYYLKNINDIIAIVELDDINIWKEWKIEINNIDENRCIIDKREYCNLNSRCHNNIYSFKLNFNTKYFVKETYYSDEDEVIYSQLIDTSDKKILNFKNNDFYSHFKHPTFTSYNHYDKPKSAEIIDDDDDDDDDEEEDEIIYNKEDDFDRYKKLPFIVNNQE